MKKFLRREGAFALLVDVIIRTNFAMKSVTFLTLCISGLILYQVLGQVQGNGPGSQTSLSLEASTEALSAHMTTVQKDAYDGKITFEQAQQQIDEWAAQHERDFRAMPLAGSIVQTSPASTQLPGTSVSLEEAALSEADANVASVAGAALTGLESPLERQAKIDAAMRSDSGKVALEAQTAAMALVAGSENALTSPLIVAVPEDATPSELASMTPREQVAQVLVDLRFQNATRPLHEVQAAIDARAPDLQPQFKAMAEQFNAGQRARMEQAFEALSAPASDSAR